VSQGSTRQLWLVPVLLITVIATALGGLLTRDLYADTAPPAPAPVLPGPPSSLPPSEQPGPVNVQGTLDATAHPLYETFRSLLQNYFEAINSKDYERWTSTVTSKRRKDAPEEDWQTDYRTTKDGSIVLYRIESGATITVTSKRRKDAPEEDWQTDYRTTKDGSIVLYRIESGADDTARVLLEFTSTQGIKEAPAELPVPCIHWNVVWAFAKENGEWRLATGAASASPQHEEC